MGPWNIVGGYAGQVSVGHSMFFGVGAYTPLLFYHLWGLPPVAGVPAGILVSLGLALVVGMPTFRLQGHYFSMATIAVAELIRIFVGTWDLVGAAIGLQGPAVGRGWWDLTFRSELPYYYIFLAVLAVVLYTTFEVERSRFGYYLRAIKAGERAARSLGVPVRETKLKALMLSALFTSLAGSLYSIKTGFIDPESGFGILVSVQMVIVAALGGAGALFGPLVGALILVPLQTATNTWFGGGGSGMLLSAQNVSKSFGSFLAVRGADLAVAEGEIIGLIGPNGAGKSTFFNCLAGDTVPTTGRVLFDGVDVTRSSAEVHARAGIGRTFQVPATFEDMTVLDNVMVGAFLRHRHRDDARESALRIIEMTGLARQSAQRARSLGTPGRKRLEIARVLATGPRLMLLDEALAGLTPTELQQAIALVRRIHELGVTLVIVEHIMEVIMTLAQRVLVFNQGHVIAHGEPREIVANEAVIEAYLGRGHRRRRQAP